MKSFVLVAAFLFTAPAFAQLGLMKQPYLHCSEQGEGSDYVLNLENAAVGNPTGITLLRYENNDWKIVTARPVTSIQPMEVEPGPGNVYFAEVYRGEGFTVTRTKSVENDIHSDNAALEIQLKDAFLERNFRCSTVE